MEIQYKHLSKHSFVKILVGVPGSGKTTLVNKIYDTCDKTNTVILSKDNIRYALGDYWIKERNNYVKELFDYSLVSAIRRGLNIIIDNAGNCFEKSLSEILNLIDKDEYDVELIILHTPLEECIKRDSELRSKDRVVGEKVIREFQDALDNNKLIK